MPRTKLQARNAPTTIPTDVRPDLVGVTWLLSDLSKATHRDKGFLSARVLKPNRDELDAANGGPVRYPVAAGGKYSIHARTMAVWIDEHWEQIQGRGW